MDLTTLPNGKINESHPLVLAGRMPTNPHILSNREAMTAEDNEKFLIAMEEEIDHLFRITEERPSQLDKFTIIDPMCALMVVHNKREITAMKLILQWSNGLLCASF
eukprot:13388543-Ditylum_brightwellii.AAC.1